MRVIAAQLVLGAALVLAAASCSSPSHAGVRVAGAASPASSPPAQSPPASELPNPASGHGLLISPTVVPESGGNLVFAVLNAAPDPAVYGVDGELDQWVDNGWQPFRAFAGAVNFWVFNGGLAPAGSPAMAPAIGLGTNNGVGALEWLHIDAIPAGWYRLRQGGGAGVFAVQAGSFPTPWGAAADHLPGLLASPAVITTGARVLDVVAMGGDGAQNTVVGAPAGQLSVDRWTPGPAGSGGSWTPVAALTVDKHPQPANDGAGEFAVDLPALDPGTYRVSGDFPALGSLTGPLLVIAR
jgi:hypothetical protein